MYLYFQIFFINIFFKEKHNSSKIEIKKHGMSDVVKDLVDDLIYNYDSRPKRIHIRLNKKNYKNKVDFMPTLRQVQDYIANRRKKIGDNNNLEELEKYVVLN